MAADTQLDTTSTFGSHRHKFQERLIWQLADWKFLPQSLRQRLRKRFARAVAGPFDIEHDAMRFRLYPAENYCDRILFGRRQLPEQAEHQALDEIIKPGMVFVDIGANVGSYSVYVGVRSQGATLIGFEPHPRTFQKLLFNLSANHLPVDHIVNAAAGEAHSSLSLWSDGGSNIGHTSLLREGTTNPKKSVEVRVVPLADSLRAWCIERIDLLKIDVEGYEDRALVPFLETAPDTLLPGHVLVETDHKHLWQQDLLAKLKERGYAPRFSTGQNLLLRRGPHHNRTRG
ncbi:MAG: FkbM family methyltransferase [Ahrensia sp.]|nr:FkbM family methyltransferase [Ahrensia sp.]